MNVPKLRFGEFSNDYVIDTFDNVINIIDGDRGNNYPKESDFYDDEYCLFLNAGNVTKKGFNFSNKYFITLKKDTELKNGKLKRNDVVLTTRGTIGNVALYDNSIPFENIRINSGMVINRIKNDKILLPQYLYQFMQSTNFNHQIKKTNFGSAQPQLTKNGITKFKIVYPCVKEQSKISIFLSLLDKKIELQSQKIQILKLYKLCISNIYFKEQDGKNYKISDFCDMITSSSKNNYIEIGGKKYIMDMGTVDSDGNIIYSKPTNYDKDIINKGDLIMPKDDIGGGLIIGKTAYIDKENKYILGDHVFCLKCKNINSLYLHYLINSNYVNKLLRKKVTGSAQLGINSKNVLNQEIFVHKEVEQSKIAHTLLLFDNNILLNKKKLEKLIFFKKGLMQNMFV